MVEMIEVARSRSPGEIAGPEAAKPPLLRGAGWADGAGCPEAVPWPDAAGRAGPPGCGLGGMLMRCGSPVVRSSRSLRWRPARPGPGAPSPSRDGRRAAARRSPARTVSPSADAEVSTTATILAAPRTRAGTGPTRGRVAMGQCSNARPFPALLGPADLAGAARGRD